MKIIVNLATLIAMFSAFPLFVSAFYGFGSSYDCATKLNELGMDMFNGSDKDGSPFMFDQDQKTIIQNRSKIVSQKTENGVETIVYKTTVPKYENGKVNGEEQITKTVKIQRDGTGKVISAEKFDDFAYNERTFGQSKIQMPLIKSNGLKLTKDGENCALDQMFYSSSMSKEGETKTYVTYDKKICDPLLPLIKSIGPANAAQCSNLVAMAQNSIKNRNEELASEGKVVGWSSQENDSPSDMNKNFTLSSIIGACISSVQSPFGYGGYYGMGPWGMNSGEGQSNKPKARSSTPKGASPKTSQSQDGGASNP
jgi:hypothetical protein